MRRPPGYDMLKRARDLRMLSPDAEKRLWRALRNRRVAGAKFRRQMWLSGYIADFACIEAKLVVEADGGQHGDNADYDALRSERFAALGYRTLRFWNNDILENLDGVLQVISDALPSPSHLPSAGGPLPLPKMGEG